MVKRLKETPKMLKMYDDVIKDQLSKGVMESVDDNLIQGKLKHFISHHAVLTPNKNTTKLRIAYDASAKSKKSNVSLNECLYRGSVIFEDLCTPVDEILITQSCIRKSISSSWFARKDRNFTRFL